MAFPGTVGDRKMDDLGFRNPQPHDVPAFPSSYAPLRLGDSTATNDVRGTIQRRFTTDSMKTSFNPRTSFESSSLQRLPIAETLDLAPAVRIAQTQLEFISAAVTGTDIGLDPPEIPSSTYSQNLLFLGLLIRP